MSVILSSLAGFCFGVKRAVDSVNKLTDKKLPGERIFTIGKLIHNQTFIDELIKKGVLPLEQDDKLTSKLDVLCSEASETAPVTVVIRTHGISREISEHAALLTNANSSFRLIDCTCPYVKKIHNIVATETTPDSMLVIIGDEKHPEVEGIRSWAKGEVLVFPDESAIDNVLSSHNRVIMVSQTTQKLTEWKKCQKKIKNLCTNALIFDTICSVTENRQTETAELAGRVDAMLVVGGRESSNTAKLYEISRTIQPRSFLIESAAEIPEELMRPDIIVGITAGASTPGSIIEEVYQTMSETMENFEDIDFGKMVDESFKTLYTGEVVKGIITCVLNNEIHVDLGTKSTGVIAFDELTDNPQAKLSDLYKVGDEIEAKVVKVSDLDGIATLSRKRVEKDVNWQKIVEANTEGTILEGKITEAVKGGLIMSINFVKIFIPASQSGLPRDADLNTLVGTTQRCKIIDINEQRNRAVGSIRAILNEERKAIAEEFWKEIEVGKKYEGVVKSLTSYGAFVDLGGVDGMVHTSELSWKRIKHPSDIVNIGDKIVVYVKEFNPETKRISLGYKTEESDPWYIFTNKYKVGDTANVKIVSMMPFGAFAEVVPGADGLIHISQISHTRIAKPEEVLELGQMVDVKIIDIDMEKRKISLSIIALDDDNVEDNNNAGESESSSESVETAE